MTTRFASWPEHGGQRVILSADNQAAKIWTAIATTSAAGALTVAVPAGAFTTVLSVTATAVRNTADPTLACLALVRSYSITQVVIQVFESKTSGVLIGGYVEGLELTATATQVLVTVIGT